MLDQLKVRSNMNKKKMSSINKLYLVGRLFNTEMYKGDML